MILFSSAFSTAKTLKLSATECHTQQDKLVNRERTNTWSGISTTESGPRSPSSSRLMLRVNPLIRSYSVSVLFGIDPCSTRCNPEVGMRISRFALEVEWSIDGILECSVVEH